MALVIGKKNTRKIRVNIDEAGDFDTFTRHTADIEFKVLPLDEVRVIEGLGNKDGEGHDEDLQVALIFDAIVNVEGLKDEDGNAIIYNDAVRDSLISTLWIRYPIMREFWSVQVGSLSAKANKQAKLKN